MLATACSASLRLPVSIPFDIHHTGSKASGVCFAIEQAGD
jgi:hypothetical protein